MATPKKSENDSNESQGAVIAGHRYDGIREYDNPMPGWWSAIFWGTVVFSVIYSVGAFYMGFVDSYEDDLNDSLEELTALRASFDDQNPTVSVDAAALALVVADEQRIEAGRGLYGGQCALCHGAEGQGLIGPNLADQYWIHGGSNLDVYEIIRVGVPAKGMAAWESVFTSDERASIVAFIRSLEGTTAADAKAPEGELYPAN